MLSNLSVKSPLQAEKYLRDEIDAVNHRVFQFVWIAATATDIYNLTHWMFAMKYWALAVRF